MISTAALHACVYVCVCVYFAANTSLIGSKQVGVRKYLSGEFIGRLNLNFDCRGLRPVGMGTANRPRKFFGPSTCLTEAKKKKFIAKHTDKLFNIFILFIDTVNFSVSIKRAEIF